MTTLDEGEAAKGAARTNIRAGLVGLIITTIVALANFPILARGLGVDGRGSFALVLAVSEIATNLFRFGIPEAVALLDKERMASGRGIFRSAQSIAFPMLLISVPCSAVLYMTILGSLPPSERWLAAGLVAWSPVFDTLGLARARFMVSRSDAVGMALSAALPSVVSFVGFVILFATGALTVFSAISVTIAASFSSYLVSFLRMRLEGAARPSPTRQMFSLAWRGAPYSAMEAVNLRLDQAVIPTLVGSAALGTYSVANSLANPLVRFGTVLSGGLYAEVKLSAPDAGRSAAGAAVRRAAAIVIVAGTSAMLLSPFAISALAGPAYSGALPMTLVLLPASGALVLAIVLANLLGALGKPALASWSQVGGLAVTLVLLVPAILLAGALGAAVVSLLSYGTRAALAFLLIRRLGVTQCIPSADDFRWVLRLVSR